ncbi:condensation domain-containing protein [Pseudoalteromonas sp.]|uniref:condensation domain-containing protein n=1 Tax=Pseudoalteromonas sp. TaxID=53249 RepID=UPI003001D666
MSYSNCKLSINQERFMLAEKFTRGNYSLPVSYIIESPLDKDKLRASIMAVMERHDVFKLSLSGASKVSYGLEVNPKIKLIIDEQTIEDGNIEAIKKNINDYFYKEVDFTESSLVRYQLIKLSNNKHVFTFSIHHMLSDGISITIFIKDLCDAWNDISSYKLKPKSSYIKCIRDNKLSALENIEDCISYWKDYLLGACDVRLSSDYILPKDKKYDKRMVSLAIGKELTRKIDILSKCCDVSAFNVLYAAYNILISRYSNKSDICTTFQSSGRQLISDSKSTIGLFSCALILRQNVDNNSTFCHLFSSIRENIYNCISNQKLPYHYIIKNTSIHPKYGINWHPSTPQLVFSDLNISKHEYTSWQSDFDLNLHCTIINDEIHLNLQYDYYLFSKQIVSTILKQFENVLTQISETESADIRLSDINLTSL